MNARGHRILLIFLLIIAALLAGKLHAQSISGTVNNYYKVTGISMTRSMLKLDNTGFLFPGQRGLLIQMKGAGVDQTTPASNSSWGNLGSINNAGKFELVRVCSVKDDSAVLETGLQNTYDVNDNVQLVIFDDYASVTISDSVYAAPWDSTTGKGGVLFIDVTDTIYLNDNLVARGAGFAGGNFTNYSQPPFNCNFTNVTSFAFALPGSGTATGGKKGEGVAKDVPNLGYGKARLANGGGGGNNHNAGGGGGSNWGAGGNGGVRARVTSFGCVGNNPGLGGVSLNSHFLGTPNRIFMGGGGGAGHGNDNVGMPAGSGGGIVFIHCRVLQGNGRNIYANGATQHRVLPSPPFPDTTAADSEGGSGGGAGGTVVIYANEVIGGLNIYVQGAQGGDNEQGGNNNCSGPGGGGGGGVVWFSSATTPPGVTLNIVGGAAGLRRNGITGGGGYCDGYTNGATAGLAGTILFNFSFTPSDTTFLCASVLPAPWVINLRAVSADETVKLSWTVTDNVVNTCIVEKSFDGIQFIPVAQLNAGNQSSYSTNVDRENSVCFYRIKAISNSQAKYSRVARVNGRPTYVQVKLYPNPVQKKLTANITVAKAQTVQYIVADINGRIILSGKRELNAGNQVIQINTDLLPGMYQLRIAGEGFSYANPFTKL